MPVVPRRPSLQGLSRLTSRRWRAVGLGVAFGLGLGLLSPPSWAETTLRAALDRAWERAVQARAAESRRTEAQASRALADRRWAEPPSIAVAEKSDRFDADRGAREREIELSLPLWLPGQRAVHDAFARSDAAHAEAALAAARLALAGELRQTVWQLAAARADVEIAAQRAATAQALEADVLRRQQAGELARTDLLLARDETLAAQAGVVEARAHERQAQSRLRLLTGLESLPEDIEEAAAARTATVHPRLTLAQAALERAQANLQTVVQDRRASPEVSLALTQSREAFAAPPRSALRIGIRVPLGREALDAPKLAAANTQRIQAEAELRQITAELEAELHTAQAALEDAEAFHQVAQGRAGLASERLLLLHKAFSLGELGLADLMPARAASSESQLGLLRAKLALSAARAQLNQARGMLP